MMYRARILMASAALLATTTASAAGEWTWLPVNQAGYKAEPTLALILGSLDPDIKGAKSDTIAGFELSLNCPLLQPPSNKIRQQLSYVSYDKNGLKISSVELNPHYVVEAAPGLWVGAGPGLGYVMADSGSTSDNMLALQVGASVHYTGFGEIFLGAEAREQVTLSNSFLNEGADNFRVAVKVGYNF